MDDSDKVWLKTNDYLLKNYYLKQYNEEYESIKFIKNYLKSLTFNNLIDFGCGSGSLIYYLKQIINSKYIGIDINEQLINIAKEKNNDCNFFVNNFQDIIEKYNLTISNQVLLIVSPELQKLLINKQFECSNKYVVFFSLFTESELDINIKINDPYNDEIVYYNIIPVNKINKIAENYGFKLKVCDNFEIKKQLSKPETPGRGTYTIETIDNKLLQFSDVIFMPWKILIYEKNNIL